MTRFDIATQIIARLRDALEKAKISHTRCEDVWYSCLATGECAQDCDCPSPGQCSKRHKCDCGADQHNKAIDKALRGRKL